MTDVEKLIGELLQFRSLEGVIKPQPLASVSQAADTLAAQAARIQGLEEGLRRTDDHLHGMARQDWTTETLAIFYENERLLRLALVSPPLGGDLSADANAKAADIAVLPSETPTETGTTRTLTWRKRPIVVEAVQYDRNQPGRFLSAPPRWLKEAYDAGRLIDCVRTTEVVNGVRTYGGHCVKVLTLEGEMHCEPGDWLICGIMGELYPCKPDIFAATYEAVESPPCVSLSEQDRSTTGSTTQTVAPGPGSPLSIPGDQKEGV